MEERKVISLLAPGVDEEEMAKKADLVDGKVPASQLPSYVDDVVEYENVEAFPEAGEQGKIYVALDSGFTYRWSGSEYIQIGGQDLSDYYTKGEANQLLDTKQPVGDYATNSALEAGLATKQDAGDYATSAELTAGLETKQDIISDLDTIRSGATAGATAVQPADVNNKLFDGVFTFQGEIGNIVWDNQFKQLILSLTVGEYIYKVIGTTNGANTQGTAYITITRQVSDKIVRDCRIFVAESPEKPAQIITIRKTESGNWATNVNDLIMSYTSNLGDHTFDYLYKHLWDTTPTADSTKPVTSGGIKTALATKQDTITDLDTVRSGAAAGATAVQPSDMVPLTNQQIMAAWQANLPGGYEEIPNEYGTTIACLGNYSTVPNEYGTTIVIE